MMKVCIVSEETIKPSSPTPKHLTSMPLSLIDQMSPVMYNRLLLFYPCDDRNKDIKKDISQLKNSLSKTLTHFYPLAGRIQEPTVGSSSTTPSIECNDDGVEFYEARVEGNLDSILLQTPTVEQFNLFLPRNGSKLRYGDPLLAVQFNAFDCGGFILGICISHQVTDAASFTMFLNSWADIAREGNVIKPLPLFNLASLFPPISLVTEISVEDVNVTRISTKHFMIKATEMEKLRAGGDAYDREQFPTRVEAVSTLIWRCVMRARGETNERLIKAVHAVNGRKRMVGVSTECSFGNLVTGVFLPMEGLKEEICDHVSCQGLLEKMLRGAVNMVNEGYIRGLVAPHEVAQNISGKDGVRVGGEGELGENLLFSSWCGFPLYKTDFGWGEPAWVSCVLPERKNSVVLTNTNDGDGMEIWLCLEKEEMERLEQDQEFIEFTSSPFHVP